MHLFSRTGLIDPEHTEKALEFCVEIAGYVSKATGLEVVPWMTLYGAPVGTVSWSCRVDSLAQMGAAQDTLAGDQHYVRKVAKASDDLFEGHAEDTIGQFVAMAGSGDVIPQYATVVTAQCASGRIADAMAWGVDMHTRVNKLTGLDGSFLRSLFGPWASVAWISLADSLDAVEAGEAATAADDGYLEQIDAGGDLFTPGTATQRLLRRLA
jgi:hypothetical protein